MEVDRMRLVPMGLGVVVLAALELLSLVARAEPHRLCLYLDMTFVRTISLAESIGALVGCGERTVADESNGPPKAPPKRPDVAAAASEDTSEDEVVCREGLTACDDECVDLSSDDEHCGACDHECRDPFWSGHCLEGACASAYWCGGVDQAPVTCEDVCALHGQVCDEGPRTSSRGCGGGYQLHFDRDALERCEVGLEGQTFVDATCTTLIDWSIAGGWDYEPAQAVSCCCTQEPPP
jgi:hypothetical protein